MILLFILFLFAALATVPDTTVFRVDINPKDSEDLGGAKKALDSHRSVATVEMEEIIKSGLLSEDEKSNFKKISIILGDNTISYYSSSDIEKRGLRNTATALLLSDLKSRLLSKSLQDDLVDSFIANFNDLLVAFVKFNQGIVLPEFYSNFFQPYLEEGFAQYLDEDDDFVRILYDYLVLDHFAKLPKEESFKILFKDYIPISLSGEPLDQAIADFKSFYDKILEDEIVFLENNLFSFSSEEFPSVSLDNNPIVKWFRDNLPNLKVAFENDIKERNWFIEKDPDAVKNSTPTDPELDSDEASTSSEHKSDEEEPTSNEEKSETDENPTSTVQEPDTSKTSASSDLKPDTGRGPASADQDPDVIKEPAPADQGPEKSKNSTSIEQTPGSDKEPTPIDKKPENPILTDNKPELDKIGSISTKQILDVNKSPTSIDQKPESSASTGQRSDLDKSPTSTEQKPDADKIPSPIVQGPDLSKISTSTVQNPKGPTSTSQSANSNKSPTPIEQKPETSQDSTSTTSIVQNPKSSTSISQSSDKSNSSTSADQNLGKGKGFDSTIQVPGINISFTPIDQEPDVGSSIEQKSDISTTPSSIENKNETDKESTYTSQNPDKGNNNTRNIVIISSFFVVLASCGTVALVLYIRSRGKLDITPLDA